MNRTGALLLMEPCNAKFNPTYLNHLKRQSMSTLKLFSIACLLTIFSACGGGDSDSGGEVDTTLPGDMLPSNFIGEYVGVLTLRATASGLSQTESVPITVTVFSNGTVSFAADDPEETFTVGITNAGNFSGSVAIEEDPCAGTITVVGSVDGVNATGAVEGSGSCTDNGLTIDVELDGEFNATK